MNHALIIQALDIQTQVVNGSLLCDGARSTSISARSSQFKAIEVPRSSKYLTYNMQMRANGSRDSTGNLQIVADNLLSSRRKWPTATLFVSTPDLIVSVLLTIPILCANGVSSAYFATAVSCQKGR